MRFLTRALLGVFLLAATAGLFAVAGGTVYRALEARWSAEPFSRPAREQVLAVNAISISPGQATPVITAFGEILSSRQLELRAPSGGPIIELSDKFRDGGAVEAGDLLVKIDPFDAQNALGLARADLREAETEVADANRAVLLAGDELAAAEEQTDLRARALERQRDLAERGVGSSANVEDAELTLSAARGQVLARRQALAQAEARIERAATALDRRQIAVAEAERRLADTEVRAPFAGTLDGVSLVQGGLVTGNERLGDLIDPTALEVGFRLSAAQYARLIRNDRGVFGADVDVTLDALGVDLMARGRIIRESASVGDGQTGRLLFAAIGKAPGFRPGDFVTVRIAEPVLSNVARIPSMAVGSDGAVLAIDSDDRLEVVPVEVLRREGDDVIIAVTDLDGRMIVAERTPLLGGGIRVRATDRTAPVEVTAAPEMLELDPERRARLVSFVEANQRMPAEAKARVLDQLSRDRVPAAMVQRIESRMGG
jgi:multidrug efflux pump subunit AcrA (membrane-fusion protein)